MAKTLPKGPKAKFKIRQTLEEFKKGKLPSGSKDGPIVRDKKQAVAIALAQARKR